MSVLMEGRQIPLSQHQRSYLDLAVGRSVVFFICANRISHLCQSYFQRERRWRCLAWQPSMSCSSVGLKHPPPQWSCIGFPSPPFNVLLASPWWHIIIRISVSRTKPQIPSCTLWQQEMSDQTDWYQFSHQTEVENGLNIIFDQMFMESFAISLINKTLPWPPIRLSDIWLFDLLAIAGHLI